RLVDLRAYQFGATTRAGARHSSPADFIFVSGSGECCRSLLAQKADRPLANRRWLHVRRTYGVNSNSRDPTLACLFERLRDGDRSNISSACARRHHRGCGAARSFDQCHWAQFDDFQYGAKHRPSARGYSDRQIRNGRLLRYAGDFLRAGDALDSAASVALAIIGSRGGRHYERSFLFPECRRRVEIQLAQRRSAHRIDGGYAGGAVDRAVYDVITNFCSRYSLRG